MFCLNCGQQLPDGAKFCGNCGATVPSVAKTTVLDEDNNQNEFDNIPEYFDAPEERPAPTYLPPQNNPSTFIPPQNNSSTFIPPQNNTSAQYQPQGTQPANSAQYQPQNFQQPQNTIGTMTYDFQPPAKPRKKKNKLLIFFLILIILGIIGGIVGGITSESDGGSSDGYQTQSTANPEYERILNEAGISHNVSFSGMSTASYVEVLGTDYCIFDYGYKGDTVYNVTETCYYSTNNATEDEITEFINQLKIDNAQYEALDCCTITYSREVNYVVVQFKITDVNLRENIDDLTVVGYINGYADYISLSATEDNRMSEGAVKK